MKKITFTLYISLLSICGIAQEHDNTWLFGYSSNPTDLSFGGTVIDFKENLPTMYYQYREMNFDAMNTSISDAEGNLLFYTNGIYIADSTHQQMENGDGLNPGEYTDDHAEYGLIQVQGAIALPVPTILGNMYYLIHKAKAYPTSTLGLHSTHLYYSLVNPTLNNGLGEAIEKNQIVIQDTLEVGKITAAKHANGRDWWLLIFEYDSANYYRVLLTPDGVEVIGKEEYDIPLFMEGLGQAAFSPDGSKFVRLNGINIELGNFLDVYDFDRCTGLLSNHQRLNYIDGAWLVGVAISPNSRFLYVASYDYLYQFDLWADDIFATKDTVAIYDGFEVVFPSQLTLPTHFSFMQLAPDGKIYSATSGAVNYLHVINKPNEKGDACEVLQHSVELPTYNLFSMPNFPNYRLGPLDGSVCDNLGINNVPLADFRYELDTIENMSVDFRDLSSYEPATWSWDFGDTNTSQDTCPVHVYDAEGIYEVCLTVSNEYGEDTRCRTVEVEDMTTATEATELEANILVYPNPTSIDLTLQFPKVLQEKTEWFLYNELGQVVRELHLSIGFQKHTISLAGLAKGIYFYTMKNKKGIIKSGRVVKT